MGDTVSDRYLLRERLGRGGMGTLFKGEDLLLHDTVALKFMHERYLRTQRGQRLFIQEAQITRRLRHDNIVTTHDVGCTPEGVFYLSMELLEGVPLREFLHVRREKRKAVSVRLAVHVMAQVLAALQYAHQIVVHRDIKPENVMLLPGERVKVLDFGLAKAIDEAGEEQGNASGKPGHVVGTLAYASPEQKLHGEIDNRSDIYSAGLLFYELLTLRTPVDPPAEVDAVRDDVSPSLLAVLKRARAQRREDRWQTAADFRNELLAAYDRAYRAEAGARAAAVAAGNGASTENMVFQEGGSFLMGSTEFPEESPPFEAHVDPFYIDKYPVTHEQYARFLEATGWPEPRYWRQPDFSGPLQPVLGVTWDDAQAFAAWCGKRLPTEAEWEFAARGKENRRYPWGPQDPDTQRANFGDYLHMPSLVTMHEEGATPEGVCDMAGNVYEWVLDCYLPYDPARAGAPARSGSPRRVARGGAWSSPAAAMRCTHRKGVFPETRDKTLGFRCALSASAEDTA